MDRQDIRPRLYYRLRWLWPILARRAVRRGLRFLGWMALAAYFTFAGLILVLRYAVLPNIGQYQGHIEAAVSQAIGQSLKIGSIEASWDGIDPRLTLSNVVVSDRQGQPAFILDQVDSVLSWRSLWHLKPILALLSVDGPALHIRRDSAGRITVAGVDTAGPSDPRVAEWALEQPHIQIRNAIVVWEDELRQAPPLILEDLQFSLFNRGKRHRFGLSAAPPSALAARIELRGDVRGSLGEALDQLSGKLFVQLDYADLAGWQAWVDYPVKLPRGQGALRLWADWDQGAGRTLADVALRDLSIRLGPKLPQLDLASLQGRLEGRYRGNEWDLAGSKVELQGLDGLRLAPTDFSIGWQGNPAQAAWSGHAKANHLDLDALDRLADYLPLDAKSRALLETHQPRGQISDLRATWATADGTLKRYAVNTRFAGLGLKAADKLPGAAGLAGELEATEQGGSLSLAAQDASLDLPAVFPEPHVALGETKAKAKWSIDGPAIDVRLERLEFSARDAAGTAGGTYRYNGQGPGVIDLTAALTRADGKAVWRYMPKVVHPNARAWLERGIAQGTASDAKLILKGDLRNFPFRDPRTGQFVVTAQAHGVKIDYAPGWPVIEGVEGTMRFGAGMRVEASRGNILGTRIGPVLVEIPDFDLPTPMLLVKGQVNGPTSEFLRFIDRSPVANKIDRFTEDMRAVGNGQLDLQLDMPLTHVLDTKVRGEYQFQNNQVKVAAALPPLTQVNGRLKLTENAISAQEITAQVLGGPMKLAVRNEGDLVGVTLSGNANLREVKQQFELPLLDGVTGSTAWKGEVRVRKKTADFIIESDLVGISSSLPEPFNKTAGSSLALRVEKKAVAATPADRAERDLLYVSVGDVRALVARRQEDKAMRIERGVVAVGEAPPAMPERGIAVALSLPRLDIDAWHRALDSGGAGSGQSAVPEMIGEITLKAQEMRLLSRDYKQVTLKIKPRESGWQVALDTHEAAGRLFWNGAGEGWLQADLLRLYLPADSHAGAEAERTINSLPGLDIRVADFAIGDKHLGKLELKAHNDAGTWHLDHVLIANPEAVLTATGLWSSQEGQRTRLDFDLAASDLGKLVDRLGYPGMLKRGTVRLIGDLTWAGPLTDIDYPSLAGEMKVAAVKGQFAKVEPGIGKLFGLLSLQSLPRRLSLDFRDVFSEGFAFDSIDAKLSITNGVMHTVEDLKINGPAAHILMTGKADLKAETQDVTVTVQPEIGNALSIGAALALANPVVGAAAVVANKILQNPLDKIFSFRYHIGGSWSDPKIEKIGQSVHAAPSQHEEGKMP